VTDRANGRRAGAAIITADEDNVGMRLSDAGSHRPHAASAPTSRKHALAGSPFEVIDQLRQILDGVNVVVGRRRNQTNSRDGVSHPRDNFVDLMTGELAPFARLGALRNLDLEVVRVYR